MGGTGDLGKMALRELLELCLRGRRDEALALLNQHQQQHQQQHQAGQGEGGGLLEQPWEGGLFLVEGKHVWNRDRALHAASMGGSAELVLALLVRGADIHARGFYGFDALMYASRHGHIAAATVLLDRGADVLARGQWQMTALHFAASCDSPELCELLLSRGSDLTAVSYDNRTPLDKYGLLVNPPLSPAVLASRRARLQAAWRAGPHPSQVQRRRGEAWARRWPFVRVLVGHDFQPTAARKLALDLLHPALPPHVAVPPLEGSRKVLLRNKIFVHPGLWRLIASFL